MAQVSYRVDDFDGKTKVNGDPTILSLNGKYVSVDLGKANAAALAEMLAPYFEKGIEVEPPTRTRKANGTGNGNASPVVKSDALTGAAANATAEEIRSWAKSNGHKVADQGRISRDVLVAFDKWANENLPAEVPTDA